MKKFSILIILLCAYFAVEGQTSNTGARSHVERFSTREARAARIEAEATEKLATSPSDAELLNERALARTQLGKFSEALSDLQKAISVNPRKADYYANLGYVLWKLGRGREAIEAERQALRLDEKNYTANYQLGRFLLRTGDRNLLPEAAEKLKKALELDPRQSEVRFELIAAFREMGDTASALGQLDILQDARPTDARVRYVAALLFIDRNDPDAAIRTFHEALKKDENLYGAWQDLGLLQAKLNRWPEAVEAFGELARRQPGSAEAAYLHALALYNAKRIADAEREARRALRLSESSSDAHALLGIILASAGDSYAEAIESLTQAVALSPNNSDAVFYLGRLQYAVKNYAAAAETLHKAVALGPKNIEARFFLGTVLEALGDSDRALTQYQEIVKLDEKSFYGQVGLGALLVKQGRLDEAVAALRQALVLDGNSFEANWALGRALILQEKFDEAADVLQKAVNLQPGRTDARYQFGIALRRLGRAEEARREFDLVEKINKEFREGRSQ